MTFFAISVVALLAFGAVLITFAALCIVAAAADLRGQAEDEGNPLCLVVDLDGARARRRDGAA